MKRDTVDFLTIAPEHRVLDLRLESWARWVKGGRRVGGVCAPMFRLYRSTDARSLEPRSASATPDELDGLAVEHAVAVLPERPREALRWHYVTPYIGPWSLARYLGCTMHELAALVYEGRELLISAKV